MEGDGWGDSKEKVGSRWEGRQGNEGTVKNGGSQTKRLGDVKRQQGAKGKDLGRLEDPPGPATLA